MFLSSRLRSRRASLFAKSTSTAVLQVASRMSSQVVSSSTLSTEPVCVYVTSPPDRAAPIARSLVNKKLAACINIVPGLTSVYQWEGKVEEDPESLLIIKTTRCSTEALYTAIKEVHPAEVPEFIVLPITAGSTPYLTWLEASTRRE